MADVTGLPCTTMSHAIVRALRTLGVRRVAVATAYTDALNHDLTRFLTGLDFEVTALEGLDMTDVLAVGRVGPDELEMRSRFTVFQATATLPLQPVVVGRYVDRVGRSGEGWRFLGRRMIPERWGDVSEHLTFDPRT